MLTTSEILDTCYMPFVSSQPAFLCDKLFLSSMDNELDIISSALDFRFYSDFKPFDVVENLIEHRRRRDHDFHEYPQSDLATRMCLLSLSERIGALEKNFGRMVRDLERKHPRVAGIQGPMVEKYTYTAELKSPVARRYEWTEEITTTTERKYKWLEEIKGPTDRKITWTVESRDKKPTHKKKLVKEKGKSGSVKQDWPTSRKYALEPNWRCVEICSEEEKNDQRNQEKKVKKNHHLVEIEEPANNHRDLILQQAFGKRNGALKIKKGKQKVLSQHEAARLIQVTFRAHAIHKSKAMHALREIAIAKNKLKELRSFFQNICYRRQVARDSEERQRFAEKIIVLLLTVDAIEGVEMTVRAAKRAMVRELEEMLNEVDPQPPGRLMSMKRRTFDMPDSSTVNKGLSEAVTRVVRLMGGGEGSNSAIKAQPGN